jgi:hypothetical protein
VVEGKPKGSSLLPLSSLYTYIIIATSSRHHEITITITINPPISGFRLPRVPRFTMWAFPFKLQGCLSFGSIGRACVRASVGGKSATRAMRTGYTKVHQFSCSFAPEWERIESNRTIVSNRFLLLRSTVFMGGVDGLGDEWMDASG